MAERVLVLSAGVGSGHNSAAKAVADAAGRRADVADVRTLDVLDDTTRLYRDVIANGYFTLAAGLPWLVEWGYDVSDPPFRRRGPIDPFTRANTLPVVKEIERFRPTTIVSTHFLPAQLVASLLLRRITTARTAVVTTDFDFQGLWLTGAMHAFFLAREEGRAQLVALGLPEDRLAATGIPISPQPEDAHRDGGPPMLLVSAGAAGGDYALTVVRQTLRMTSRFRATVVCGHDAALKRRIERLVAGRPEYTVLGFTTEMPRLLREASLFIGKPGGLSSSECMAAGLPMVLVNPIPGQEVRNGDHLMESGAAVRCNSTATIGWKIDRILAEPGRLGRMQAAAAALARPRAADDVLDVVLRGPALPLAVSRAAQKTILAASERHLVAADLTGPTALVPLVDDRTGVTAAVLRRGQLQDLRDRTGQPDGPVVVTRESTQGLLADLRWEARRLIRCLLGDADRMTLVPAGALQQAAGPSAG